MGQHRLKERQVELPIKEDYESIEITGFRGIKHLKIDNLGKVNLILGRNDAGKTSLLEALFSHAVGQDAWVHVNNIALAREEKIEHSEMYIAEHILTLFNIKTKNGFEYSIIAKFRNDNNLFDHKVIFEPAYFLKDIAPQYKRENFDKYIFSQTPVETDDKKRSFGRIHFGEIQDSSVNKDRVLQQHKKTKMLYFTNHRQPYTDASIFSTVKRAGKLVDYLKFMRNEFGDIESIEFIPYPDGKGGDIYVIKNDSSILPMSSYGDGFRKVAMITINMFEQNDCLFLIDEAENGLHYSLQKHIAQNMMMLAERNNNQIFLTSHSLEFTDNFLSALYGEGNLFNFSEANDPIRVITLEKDPMGDEIAVWNRTGRKAYELRQELYAELRG